MLTEAQVGARQIAHRRKKALAAAPKLHAAATALREYLRACNECGDASMSLSRQGKGRDGREKLIADLTEYAVYLEDVYRQREPI